MTATRLAEASGASAIGPAYAAFISYSRDADGRLAPRLENALERFATPWYRLRAFRVFRDDASLSTNPGLWSSLTGALDGVGYFILLASPGAAASVWVGREVEYWLEHRERERLLIVLTGGEIVWDEQTGDFDWERTTALPRAISGAYTEEPRYTDLRFASHTDQLSVRDPRFRAAVADVAAPLHGIAKDDLIGEEVRQHRRTMRIARSAGIALALLTVAASIAAVLAVRSADRANRERDRAEREAALATSRQLAAQSTVALQDSELDSALDQAARAWRTSHTTEARDAVLAALKGAGGVEAAAHGPRPVSAAVSGDRGKVAVLGAEDGVRVFDLTSGKPVGEPLAVPHPDSVSGVALDARGQRLAVGYSDGKLDLWDLARRTVATLTREPDVGAGAQPQVATRDVGAYPAFSADGRRLAWGGRSRTLFVWDGQRARRLVAPEYSGDSAWRVALSGDGRFLAATGDISTHVLVWRVDRPGPPRALPGAAPRSGALYLGDRGVIALGAGRRPVLAVGEPQDGRVVLWDAASGRRIATRTLRAGRIDSLAFSPGGRVIAVVNGRAVTLLDRSGKTLGTFGAAGAGYGAVPVDERGRTATIGATGDVLVRSPAPAETQFAPTLQGASSDLPPVAFDPPGRRVASVDRDSSLRIWDASGGRPLGPAVAHKVASDEVGFLRDGRVATCCGTGVRIWAADGSGPGGAVPVPRGELSHMAVTSDGRIVTLTANYRDHTTTISGAGRPLVFHTELEATLSPDGRWASVQTDDGADVWDLDHRRKTATLPEPVAAFSPTRPARGDRHRPDCALRSPYRSQAGLDRRSRHDRRPGGVQP